ncbi:MAG: tRNA synthetases class I-domain-containing protein, partial [Olpidium bornovanus]
HPSVQRQENSDRHRRLRRQEFWNWCVKSFALIVTEPGFSCHVPFSLGAVKITPAHDPNDYHIGNRHKLAFINILNDDGTINANGEPFAGIKRFDARLAVTQKLTEMGLFHGTKDNPMTIPICQRSGDVIEQLLKPQWYVACKDMAEQAMQAVRDKRLTIQPKQSEDTWFRWLEDTQDWCVSRQLWWGHRIPAYFVKFESKEGDRAEDKFWVSGITEEEALVKAQERFPNEKFTLEQDPDVLDTWFSSGLWPFSILGWPEETSDVRNFYPNSLLETGRDILFFWVARMVMLGMKLTGQVPFSEVFCHAMVRDAHGRKMSKSLGNVIDPIDVIEGISLQELQKRLDRGNLDPREVAKAKEGQRIDYPNGIPQCGTDALRFALCAYTASGASVNLDILRVDGYRRFCNKLWNATRFCLMKLGGDFKPNPSGKFPLVIQPSGKESLADKWVLTKLNKAIAESNASLEKKDFKNATTAVHSFWLYDLCDTFIVRILRFPKPTLVARGRAWQN